MARVQITTRALADLERLFDFIAVHNPKRARERMLSVRRAFELLSDHPLLGRPAEDGRRELVFSRGRYGYVAKYRWVPAASPDSNMRGIGSSASFGSDSSKRHCHWQYSVSARVMRERGTPRTAALGIAVRKSQRSGVSIVPPADFESRRAPKIAFLTFRRATVVILAFIAFGRTNSFAAEQSGNTDALAEVLVTGERPGPGMWRVSKGNHDLWILATLAPLPKKMIWRSQAVEMRIASSQVVMTPPQFTPDIGLFRGITLLPSLLRARHSPDGKTLEEELPHELYIRWLALRVKYLGHSDEKMRPMLAAFDLYSHALDQVGLTPDDDEVWDVVKKTANAHHVPIDHINIKVPINNPKGAIRGLDLIPRDAEITCLAKIMERLETDLQPMVRRANLWSLGDIDGLRAMPFPNEGAACQDAFLTVPQLKSQFSQVDASMYSAWLLAADNALANNVSSFTVLAIAELLEPDGLLAKLRAKGYVVEEPQTEKK